LKCPEYPESIWCQPRMTWPTKVTQFHNECASERIVKISQYLTVMTKPGGLLSSTSGVQQLFWQYSQLFNMYI